MRLPWTKFSQAGRWVALGVVLGLAPAGAVGAEALRTAREQILRMTDFFDTTLPGTLGKRNLAFHFSPKFADLRDHEYVRLPFEIRYGATENIDVTGGLAPFFPNPVNSGRDHRWGLGEMKLGARYDLGERLNFFDDTTVGVEWRVPLGKPPVTLNDHYLHVRPFISAQHTLNRWPDTRFYANVSYDHSLTLASREAPPPEVVRRHVAEVVPGLLFKPGEFGTFAEYRLRHIREPMERYVAHEARIGGIWDVPLARSERWRLPGKWQLEVAYKHEFAGERGRDVDHGVVTRVSWRTTLREVLTNTFDRSPGTAR